MLVVVEGIILKTIKYGETSLICHIFTRNFGKISVIAKGVRSISKSKLKAQLLQPGNVLKFEIYKKTQGSLSLLKDFSVDVYLHQLRDNIAKTCIQLFAVELLNMIIVEEYEQEDIYDFTLDFFKRLESRNQHLAYLPSWFLIQLNKLSGYHINNNYDIVANPFFNINSGAFDSATITIATQEVSSIISKLLDIEDMDTISHQLEFGLQNDVLKTLLEFNKIHYPNFTQLKSLPILNSILA